MATKHVHRYTIRAELGGDIEYDPAKPETYTAALEQVAAVRKVLIDAGATIKHESAKPVIVRSNGDE